jgi:hypothetical protein
MWADGINQRGIVSVISRVARLVRWTLIDSPKVVFSSYVDTVATSQRLCRIQWMRCIMVSIGCQWIFGSAFRSV